MSHEKNSLDAASDERTEVKLDAGLVSETLHDSALRGHLATDKSVLGSSSFDLASPLTNLPLIDMAIPP
jgi:hypothetical protein